MNRRSSVIAAMIAACVIVSAQDRKDQDLARLLADSGTRESAVNSIRTSGRSQIATLLLWTKNPPPQVDKYELYIGLADAFRELKTKEAIPFLIKNINLQRWPIASAWTKTSEVIEQQMPAVAALVQIGAVASNALIQAALGPMVTEDRLATIFVISQINDANARDFLSSARAEASLERFWADEGLKRTFPH